MHIDYRNFSFIFIAFSGFSAISREQKIMEKRKYKKQTEKNKRDEKD